MSTAYAIVPADQAAHARELALEALAELGDVDESTLQSELCTNEILPGEFMDVVKFQAEVTPHG